jgi:hypothetical protein
MKKYFFTALGLYAFVYFTLYLSARDHVTQDACSRAWKESSFVMRMTLVNPYLNACFDKGIFQ